jgi:HSP20 family molecular chaperone IbpA
MPTENPTVNAQNVPSAQRVEAKRVTWYRPAVDVFETPDGLQILLDVPGVKPDGIEVHVEGRVLTVQGVRSYGASGWRRSFHLPDGLDTEHIAAKAEDGVLRLDVPMTEARKPRKIEVR